MFEEVVGHEPDRRGLQDAGAGLLAADALLHDREVEGRAVLPGEQFAVDDDAVREGQRGGLDLRVAALHEFLAP